jgi:hypothetical protein
MNAYRWRIVTGPILFGLQGVFVLRSLRIDHTLFGGGAIPVPLYRSVRPVYVAVDSTLPAGYDMQYDYDAGTLTLYQWNGTSWVSATSITGTLNLRVLMIYETMRAS